MIYPLASPFGEMNWIFIALIGLLLFGKRLPEVGRSVGRGIVEFKKGLAGVEDELTHATDIKPSAPAQYSVNRLPAGQASQPAQTQAAIDAGYKFDPFTGKPLQVDAVTGQPTRFDPYTGKPISQEAAAGSNGGPNLGI